MKNSWTILGLLGLLATIGVSISASAAGTSRDEVIRAYRDCLGRAPESESAIQLWMGQPNARQSICTSQEAKSRNLPTNEYLHPGPTPTATHTYPLDPTTPSSREDVIAAYRDCLGRAPESETAIQNWMVVSNARQGICNSPEANSKNLPTNEYLHPGTTPTSTPTVVPTALPTNTPSSRETVIKAYQDCLGRAPESEAAIQNWMALANARQGICTSQEARNKNLPSNEYLPHSPGPQPTSTTAPINPGTVGPVNWQIGAGGIHNLSVGGFDMMREQNKYKPAMYLIGSCDTSDNNDNISSYPLPWMKENNPIAIGEVKTYSGTMRTLDKSGSCAGPNYTWKFTRPSNESLIVEVTVGPLPGHLTALLIPTDLTMDLSNNSFQFSRSNYNVYTTCGNSYPVNDGGRMYRDLPDACDGGTPGQAKVGIAGVPYALSWLQWCNQGEGLCLRETILSGSNFASHSVIKHNGTHNLQNSWQGGNLTPGAVLKGNFRIDITPR